MSGMIRLENRSVIEIGGPDAAEFLQGILTNDIAGTKDGRAVYAGLLTPQGKLLFDFFSSNPETAIWSMWIKARWTIFSNG